VFLGRLDAPRRAFVTQPPAEASAACWISNFAHKAPPNGRAGEVVQS
jgi:hypothetical protein